MTTVISPAGADFSECRRYRYALWRHWDWKGPENCVMFVGLNPSTADETKNDKTISNCVGFAKKWGYGGIYMLNLFAFRATDPKDMIVQEDPGGPGNAAALAVQASGVGLIVAAWGSVATKYRPRLAWQSRIQTTLDRLARPHLREAVAAAFAD
jgi:hypothetical protein